MSQGLSIGAGAKGRRMTKFVDPTDIVGATFWLVSIAMAAATVFLLFERRRVADRWKAPVTVAGVVTLVSAIQYFYLREVWDRGRQGLDGSTGSSTGSSPCRCRR